MLGQAGNVQERFKNIDAVTLAVLEGKIKKSSRKITSGTSGLLEITVPVYLDEKIVGFARLGLNRTNSDKILKENRNRMIILNDLRYGDRSAFDVRPLPQPEKVPAESGRYGKAPSKG